MSTLLLRLEGPMQSWGTRSRFSHRDTGPEPTKSGVLGLVCAALGRPRTADLRDLAGLALSVRIDAPGRVETDFHTAEDVPRSGNPGAETVMSWRHYLADARFLVALSGDRTLLDTIEAALRNPRWPLFLGRKAFVPARPIHVPGGLGEESPADVLARWEWPTEDDGKPVPELTWIREVTGPSEGDAVQDVPISFALGDRQFGIRYVRREPIRPARERGK